MRHIRSVTPSQVEVELQSNNSKSVFSCRSEDQIHASLQSRKSPYIVKVNSFLYFGSLEAAYSEPLLCRFRIGSMVDVSARHPNQVTRDRKSSCPCTCPLAVAHSRAKLTVLIEPNDKEDITPFFKEINTFIHHHRLHERNVLVFSDTGLNRAPTIIAQYLILMEHQSLASILAHLTCLRPKINIDRTFFTILQKLERKASRTNVLAPSLMKTESGVQKLLKKTSSFKKQTETERANGSNCEVPTETTKTATGWKKSLRKSVVLAWT